MAATKEAESPESVRLCSGFGVATGARWRSVFTATPRYESPCATVSLLSSVTCPPLVRAGLGKSEDMNPSTPSDKNKEAPSIGFSDEAMKTALLSNKAAAKKVAWFLVCAMVLLSLVPRGLAGPESSTGDLAPEKWVYEIPPGAKRDDVYKMLGAPDGFRVFESGMLSGGLRHPTYEYYKKNGVYLFEYEGDGGEAELKYCGLVSIEDFEGEQVSQIETCYVRYGDDRRASEEYYAAGDFRRPPKKPNSLRYSCRKYHGVCYPIPGGFINVVGFVGRTDPVRPFTETILSVTLLSPGKEPSVIYHIKDHWAEFRPHYLTEDAVAERERKLRERGLRSIGGLWKPFLGKSDGSLMQNIGGDHVYYFAGGLIVFSLEGMGDEPARVQAIKIISTSGVSVDLQEWLSREQKCVGPN